MLVIGGFFSFSPRRNVARALGVVFGGICLSCKHFPHHFCMGTGNELQEVVKHTVVGSSGGS